CFDLGGGVDVADHDRPGVLCFPLAQLIRVDGVCQGTPRICIRDKHSLFRRENLGGFRHKMHAAKDHFICIGFCRDARKPQGITNVVCNVLNLWQLVIVRENHRIALTRKYADFLRPSTTRRVANLSISDIEAKCHCHHFYTYQTSMTYSLADHNPCKAIKSTWKLKSDPTHSRKTCVTKNALHAVIIEI